MTDIVAIIAKSGWALATFLIVITASLLAKIAPEILRARVRLSEIESRNERQRQYHQIRQERAARAIIAGDQIRNMNADPARNVVDTNFDTLEKYYDQTLAENRLLSRAAIGVAILGFFVILIGVALAFSGYTSVGVVSAVAGLLAEAATLMFFNQLREQVRQVQDYHKKLVSTQYLMTSIALTRDLSGDRHDAEIVRIISNLLFLSNELHGSKSDHLFGQTMPLIDNAGGVGPVATVGPKVDSARSAERPTGDLAVDGAGNAEKSSHDLSVNSDKGSELSPIEPTALDGVEDAEKS